MRRRVEGILGSILMSLALTTPALPQGTPAVAVPLTIQVVLTKGEGDKKVSSPYSLASSSGEITQLRLGSEVPIGAGGGFTYQQIGTQIDSKVTAADGRYKVQITITNRDVYDASPAPTNPQVDASKPVLYNFIFAGTVLLGSGETAQISGTDLVTNETWRADITLSLKK